MPILSRAKSGTEVNSHHRRLLDGAEAVDENVHFVLHRNSCIWREERRGCGVESIQFYGCLATKTEAPL